ncbi:MAG TPA: hypothetical protein DCZ72_04875, partial [Armatimonadetes bacterium]|nr:hypothetical protein [Armatimonadota bacterium]
MPPGSGGFSRSRASKAAMFGSQRSCWAQAPPARQSEARRVRAPRTKTRLIIGALHLATRLHRSALSVTLTARYGRSRLAGKYGLAVLGYAHGHVGVYADQIRGFDDAEVLTCWDHDAARGESQAAAHGHAYTADLDAVLRRDDVRGVMIGAETNRHADLAVAAAQAGKDILIQKPLAFTLEDCDRIIAAVDAAGVRAMVAYQMRCDPLNQKLRELVHSGTIGRVGYIRRRHCISVLFNPDFHKTW